MMTRCAFVTQKAVASRQNRKFLRFDADLTPCCERYIWWVCFFEPLPIVVSALT